VDEAKSGDLSGIQFNALGMSDMGRVRKNNEDNMVLRDLTTGETASPPVPFSHRSGPMGALFLVADGMGGEASGEVASQMCVDTVPQRFFDNLKSLGGVRETNFVLLLREAIEYANQLIFQKAGGNPAYRGMGTTATAAALFGPHLFVGQVGDSRAYLVRGKRMVQLTRDQTFLNYLAEIGAEVPEDPETDSRKSILTQAVGTSETVDVKVTYTNLRQSDRLLLCSDGLYNMVKLPDLLNIMVSDDTLPNKGKRLITKANENGGTDNITLVLVEFCGPGLSPLVPDA
jgi:serine/threonine protein phosphatase PrpC